MKRKIVIVLMILVCFLLQSTVFQSLSIASISPNLLIILTSAYGFMKGKKEGMAVGFFCGLLEDIFFGLTSGNARPLVFLYWLCQWIFQSDILRRRYQTASCADLSQ